MIEFEVFVISVIPVFNEKGQRLLKVDFGIEGSYELIEVKEGKKTSASITITQGGPQIKPEKPLNLRFQLLLTLDEWNSLTEKYVPETKYKCKIDSDGTITIKKL